MSLFAVMVKQRLLHFLMVLLSIHAVSSHVVPHRLQCTNDFVNAVSCVWNSSREDCWILGEKKIRNRENFQEELMIRNCTLKQRENSPPGCSFVFENEEFSGSEVLPKISVRCNGTLVESLTGYNPSHHIKMHRPRAPHVSSSANGTRVWWRLEGPVSYLFKSRFNFELQLKNISESWEKAKNHYVKEPELRLPDQHLMGLWQLRVRVNPVDRTNSQWSDWSPTTTWRGEMEAVGTVSPNTSNQGPWGDQAFLIVTGVTLISFLIIFLVLALYRRKRSILKMKPVPNPSKYFNTLHSIHRGDLKEWLNPLSLSESIFTAQLCDLISPVEVCGDWVALASAATGSTRGLLSHQSCRSSGSNTSSFGYHSSSLSNYSNMGYFMSSSSGTSTRTDPSPVYFTYQDDFCPHPFLASDPSYESLKKEPSSPDSGIGFIKGSEETNKRHIDAKQEECPPFLFFPQHLPSCISTSSVPPASPHTDPATQTSSQSLQEEVAEVAAGSSSAAPLASGSVCRSSSMPVETCRSGYLTLKELQATFSNKSI